MAKNDKLSILLPVGRLVQGSCYNPNTTDAEGRALVYKTGPNAGQPRVDYYLAIAIPKTPGVTHWAGEAYPQDPKIGEWGAKIWNFGHQAWPAGQAQAPTFAWKITDGDSQIPNKAGKRPCDTEGFPGHWILRLSSSYAPKIVSADGRQTIDTPDAVKCGYYVQAYISVGSNQSTTQPGIFLNHSAVALAGYGPEIFADVDTASMGFGGAALPPGASTIPLAAAAAVPPGAPAVPGVPGVPGVPAVPGVPGVPAAPAVPGVPGVPGVSAAPGAVPGVPGVPAAPAVPGAVPCVPAAPAVPGVPSAPAVPGVPGVPGAPAVPGAVAPNHAFVNNAVNPGAVPGVPGAVPPVAPGVPAAPAVPAVPAAPVEPQLTPVCLAQFPGMTYQAFVAGGWTDGMLRSNGYIA